MTSAASPSNRPEPTRPASSEVQKILQQANAFWTQGKLDQAIVQLERALSLAPDHAEAQNNLGLALMTQGKVSKAIVHYQRALALKPNVAGTHYNLGLGLWAQGQVEQAAFQFERVLALQPDHVIAHNNFLYAFNYTSRHDPAVVYRAHLAFAQRWEAPLAALRQAHTNDRSRARRLRIGYVSSDFKQHSVAHFIEPVLKQHDRNRFEIFCYFNSAQEDELTKRFKTYADHWRGIAHLSDDLAANQIREDRIDILIDLNGHTAHNRLLVFARKPAPVQVTWLGYPNTTGLSTMDYRLVDRFTDPVGMTEHLHSETLVRLPECFSCYQPPANVPDVSALPACGNGYVTFGSFNNLGKITPDVMALWARVLQAVPGSRLVLKNINLSEQAVQQSVRQAFAAGGVAPDRLELIGFEVSSHTHLERYHNIDIGLDPFPYNGATTTCEALWMGVPVITLSGRTHAGRVGVSLLSNLNLTEFIANTTDEYVAAALRLTADLETLSALRRELRARMAVSPLTHAQRFTQNLEQAYWGMWEDCDF